MIFGAETVGLSSNPPAETEEKARTWPQMPTASQHPKSQRQLESLRTFEILWAET